MRESTDGSKESFIQQNWISIPLAKNPLINDPSIIGIHPQQHKSGLSWHMKINSRLIFKCKIKKIFKEIFKTYLHNLEICDILMYNREHYINA